MENFAEDSYNYLLKTNIPVERSWIDLTVYFVDSTELVKHVSDPRIEKSLEIMKADGAIDEFELRSVNRLLMAFKQDANWDEFVQLIDELSSSYENRYERGVNEGELLGATLAIANASKEWWIENPNAPYSQEQPSLRLLPAWLAADAVGAVLGGVISYAYQEATGDCNENDPCDLGGAILAGAVMGSTGVAGKAGRWISKLF